jgi:hypothetical protein
MCDHPLAKDFVFETPAELIARFEQIGNPIHAN